MGYGAAREWDAQDGRRRRRPSETETEAGWAVGDHQGGTGSETAEVLARPDIGPLPERERHCIERRDVPHLPKVDGELRFMVDLMLQHEPQPGTERHREGCIRHVADPSEVRLVQEREASESTLSYCVKERSQLISPFDGLPESQAFAVPVVLEQAAPSSRPRK
jgi:hypothetical protein